MAEYQEPIEMERFMSRIDALLTEKLEGLATKKDLADLATKVDGLETKMDGLATKVDGLVEQVNGLVEQGNRLIAATPGAAKIPRVFVAGNKSHAEKDGSTSTWTLVKAPTEHVQKNAQTRLTKKPRSDKESFFLVSSAHCVHAVLPGIEQTGKLPICCNAQSVISKTKVNRVGFHKQSSNPHYTFGDSPHTDIVFLENCGHKKMKVNVFGVSENLSFYNGVKEEKPSIHESCTP
jgi:hypothetical protein